MTAIVIVSLVIIGGVVVLVIMLRDAWHDRGIVDEDDWVADADDGWFGDRRACFARGGGLGGGCGGSGV